MSLSNLSLKNNRHSELFGIFGIVLTFWPRQRVQNSLKSHGVKVGAKKKHCKGIGCRVSYQEMEWLQGGRGVYEPIVINEVK